MPQTSLLLSYQDICSRYPSSLELQALNGPWRNAKFIDMLPHAYAVLAYCPQFLKEGKQRVRYEIGIRA